MSATKKTLTATTKFGTFTRTTAKEYKFAVVAKLTNPTTGNAHIECSWSTTEQGIGNLERAFGRRGYIAETEVVAVG